MENMYISFYMVRRTIQSIHKKRKELKSILARSYFQDSKHLFRPYPAPKTYNASEKPDKKHI